MYICEWKTWTAKVLTMDAILCSYVQAQTLPIVLSGRDVIGNTASPPCSFVIYIPSQPQVWRRLGPERHSASCGPCSSTFWTSRRSVLSVPCVYWRGCMLVLKRSSCIPLSDGRWRWTHLPCSRPYQVPPVHPQLCCTFLMSHTESSRRKYTMRPRSLPRCDTVPPRSLAGEPVQRAAPDILVTSILRPYIRQCAYMHAYRCSVFGCAPCSVERASTR